jgi:hypothetical protein
MDGGNPKSDGYMVDTGFSVQRDVSGRLELVAARQAIGEIRVDWKEDATARSYLQTTLPQVR